MGFKDQRQRLLAALLLELTVPGHVFHEDRPDVKNLVASGELQLFELIEIVKRSQGWHYGARGPHHEKQDCEVHELKNVPWRGVEYYVKWYFEGAADLWFISVHLREEIVQ